MKIITSMASILVLCSVLMGCANTANGMHEDWREGTRSIANSTGN